MKCFKFFLLIFVLGGTWRLVQPTCVFESDFGAKLICGFKKSGMGRIRNLGGLKFYIDVGLSVGDELGFKESISNTEINNRRRSTQLSKLQQQTLKAELDSRIDKSGGSIPTGVPIAVMKGLSQPKKKSTSTMLVVPPFKPIPAESSNSNKVVPAGILGIAVPSTMFKKGMDDSSKIKVIAGVTKADKLSSTDFAIRTAPAPVPSQSSPQLANRFAPSNFTEDDLTLAILRKQQQLKKTTTSTPKPIDSSYNKIASSIGKVMNAPKEYYPVGYDKNFDDNFASRVELPETSFYCGNQKHFPGLYADEDLGCMVFHVCALTDDGLIMKSFLCPESTLFDQTILKCNWWFYVDCKISKKLYDSNFPISKSYQLMKALTFFSTYKKETPSTTEKTDETD